MDIISEIKKWNKLKFYKICYNTIKITNNKNIRNQILSVWF